MNCNTPCAICPNRNNPKKIVKCDGDLDARVLFIAEKPGINEDYQSKPFVGMAGLEFNKMYLPSAGLHRGNIMLTNSVRCFAVNNGGNPTHEQAKICAEHHLSLLLPQMRNLSVVVLTGAVAYNLARTSNRDLDVQHGIPFEGELCGTKYFMLPVIHPAAGLHKPNYIQQCREDFRALRDILKTGRWLPTDDYAGKEIYKELKIDYDDDSTEWVDILLDIRNYSRVAIDTETDGGEPWCLTFSFRPGTGYMVRVGSPIINDLSYELSNKKIVLHNALYDYPVLRKMGIDLRWDQVHDTMIEAYNRCMPQGLKTLAYRMHYMEMSDYSDVVKPYAEAAMRGYIESARDTLYNQDAAMGYLLGLASYLQIPQEYKSSKVQEKHDLRYAETLEKMGMSYDDAEQAIATIIYLNQYYPWHEKGSITPYKKLEGLLRKNEDYEKRFDKLPSYVMDRVEALCGEKPSTGISQVPYDEALWYACLSGDSRVETESGYKRIADLVKQRSTERVWCRGTEGVRELRPITGWYKVSHNKSVQWLSVKTDKSIQSGRWSSTGTRYTPDHRLLTPTGLVEVQDLKIGDAIYMPVNELTYNERQVLIGSRLGDGAISRRNKNGWANLRVTHTADQKEYLDWKFNELLSNIATEAEGENIGELSSTVMYSRATRQHPSILEFVGNKHVGTWIDELDALALAIWYQDDGTLVSGRYARFCCEWTTGVEADTIIRRLAELGIKAVKNKPTKRKGFNIHVLSEGCKALFPMIAKYVHPCMQYKLPLEYRGLWVKEVPSVPNGLVIATVTDVYSNPISKGRRGSVRTSYCIDVAGAGNFCTMYEVAKNCRDADATIRVDKEFMAMPHEPEVV